MRRWRSAARWQGWMLCPGSESDLWVAVTLWTRVKKPHPLKTLHMVSHTFQEQLHICCLMAAKPTVLTVAQPLRSHPPCHTTHHQTPLTHQPISHTCPAVTVSAPSMEIHQRAATKMMSHTWKVTETLTPTTLSTSTPKEEATERLQGSNQNKTSCRENC